MNISGRFTTDTSVEALTTLASAPAHLESVATLADVTIGSAGEVTALFTPVTALGRLALRVTITTVSRDDRGARLRVVGRQGDYLVDVDLALTFADDAAVTAVAWDAEVVVRGTAASVGQRVARDLARRVIGDVLSESARVAGQRA